MQYNEWTEFMTQILLHLPAYDINIVINCRFLKHIGIYIYISFLIFFLILYIALSTDFCEEPRTAAIS